MNDKELKILVEFAKELGISASIFDEIYKICGGNYYEILYVLNDCRLCEVKCVV